jgi:hypothetical protein
LGSASSLVLITTATNPPEGVFVLGMTNVAKRTITAKASVFFWSALGVKKIVISDATGQTLLDDSDVLMLNQMDTEIEQIYYFQDNDLVISKGKGRGEAALIKFALENSKFLQSTESFFKCTGKIYCRNYLDIFAMIQRDGIQNIFWGDAFDHTELDTRFYYASKDFMLNIFLPACDAIDDRNHILMEHCALNGAREHLKSGLSIRPMLSGFSGSSNRPYFDSSLGFLDQNLPCWFS